MSSVGIPEGPMQLSYRYLLIITALSEKILIHYEKQPKKF